jgi:hypothetical protein
MRHGYGQYFMGTGFWYLAASAVSRFNQKPYVLGGMAIMWGWLKSALQRKPRYGDAAFRRFLRRYQLRALLLGKRRAIEELTQRAPAHAQISPAAYGRTRSR